jgi:hypothetical protein
VTIMPVIIVRAVATIVTATMRPLQSITEIQRNLVALHC